MDLSDLSDHRFHINLIILTCTEFASAAHSGLSRAGYFATHLFKLLSEVHTDGACEKVLVAGCKLSRL